MGRGHDDPRIGPRLDTPVSLLMQTLGTWPPAKAMPQPEHCLIPVRVLPNVCQSITYGGPYWAALKPPSSLNRGDLGPLTGRLADCLARAGFVGHGLLAEPFYRRDTTRTTVLLLDPAAWGPGFQAKIPGSREGRG